MLHHARMEAVGLAVDRLALRIEAGVADAREARHHAAQARAPTGSPPSPLLPRRDSGVITGLSSTVRGTGGASG